MNQIQQVGSRFIVEPSGVTLTSEEQEQLHQLKPAGIMLRSRNFLGSKVAPRADGAPVPYEEMLDSLTSLLADIYRAIGRERVLICIDHEGGRVVRPPLPITPFPYPAYWGSELPKVVNAFATELISLGVNTFFGPVADIHSNPSNPVINERALGRCVAEVVPRAIQYHRILRDAGMLTCAKHFPGHGDTTSDSHFELPVLNFSKAELHAREFLPFKALIDEGIPMVMSAHLLLPQIDAHLPATISREVMSQILRNELGFNGVAVADALAMQAILPRILTHEFAEQLIQAEVDLCCVVGPGVSIGTALTMAQNVLSVTERTSELAELQRLSSARVAKVSARAARYPVTALSSETFATHHALADMLRQQSAWAGPGGEYIPEGF